MILLWPLLASLDRPDLRGPVSLDLGRLGPRPVQTSVASLQCTAYTHTILGVLATGAASLMALPLRRLGSAAAAAVARPNLVSACSSAAGRAWGSRINFSSAPAAASAKPESTPPPVSRWHHFACPGAACRMTGDVECVGIVY